jgi:hypothetical protein
MCQTMNRPRRSLEQSCVEAQLLSGKYSAICTADTRLTFRKTTFLRIVLQRRRIIAMIPFVTGTDLRSYVRFFGKKMRRVLSVTMRDFDVIAE